MSPLADAPVRGEGGAGGAPAPGAPVAEPAAAGAPVAEPAAAGAAVPGQATGEAPAADRPPAGPSVPEPVAAAPPVAGPDPATAPPTAPRRRWRRALGHGATALAALLVLVVLVLPREPSQLVPAALLRVPVEGIAGFALLLLLPARARAVAAVAGGAALGLLAVLHLLDLGFRGTLGRPFDPVLDWTLLDDAGGYLRGTIGEGGAAAVAVLAGLLVVGLVGLTAGAVLRLARVAAARRRAAVRALAGASVVWLACLGLGAQLVTPVPVASRSTLAYASELAAAVPASLRDREVFAAEAAVDAFRDTPPAELLPALRGKDVVVAFVESYGRDAVTEPEFAAVGDALDAGAAQLGAAGFAARSGWLTAPISGGGSWLAHATFLSGLHVDNQQRFRSLVSSDRLTLPRAFRDAGWDTVAVMPGTSGAWPEGDFYGHERLLDERAFGYRGPKFGWSAMPDQFAMAQFQEQVYGVPGRGPLFAEIALTSSHSPWTPVPRTVDPAALGDGSGFFPMALEGEAPDAVFQDPARARPGYARAVAYSLETLFTWAVEHGGEDLVLVVLGDHQPAPVITGEGASLDVPVTIITRDGAVLDRTAGWEWDEGVRPRPDGPVWPMEAVRDRFLTAFGD